MSSKLIKVNPNEVQKKTLYTGNQIPVIGLGTFGSDHITHKEVADAVKYAIEIGYRHIDCASVYGNENTIGETISDLINESIVKREELWITSKVWNDMHGDGQVIASCKQSIKDLQVEYLDLYLVHWPFPNYHAVGCDVDSRNVDSKPYIHEDFMKVWRQMEKLVELGLVKNIGTSNVTIPKLELILKDAIIKPSVNEMELHPHFQQLELFNYCQKNNIQPIGYSPVGSPARPERDKTTDDTVDIEDPVIVKIAQRLDIHPATVCILWATQRGQIPIPFSSNPKNILKNIEAVINNSLTEEEMIAISQIDKNCRLIKGQVFLWEDAKGWEDLWDLNGKITT